MRSNDIDPRPDANAGAEPQRSPRLKDIDAAHRAQMIFMLSWFVPALLILSVAAGFGALGILELTPLQSVLVSAGFAIGGAGFFYIVIYRGFVLGTASLIGRLYWSDSPGTPPPPTYWRADAASARGAHTRALQELEAAALEDPHHPGPYLRAAALCVQQLHDPAAAVEWYRRARRAERIEPETAAYVTLRLAEIQEEMGEEGSAMVELRRLLTLYPESQYAERAREELARMKARQTRADPLE